MKRFPIAIALVGSFVLQPTLVGAVTLAFDRADDSAYLSGWQDGDNGGFGFQPWQFSAQPSPATPFIGSSIANGDGIDDGNIQGQAFDGDIDGFVSSINNPGKSWGVSFGTNGFTSFSANRLFSNPLAVGETFSFDLDNGYFSQGNSTNGAVIIGIGNASNVGPRLMFVSTNGNYLIGQGFIFPPPSPLTFADEGLRIEYLRDTSTTYQMTVTLRNGVSHTVSGNASAAADRLLFYVQNQGPVSFNAYLNSMRITGVPEPATCMLMAIGLGTVSLLRRRKL